MNKKGILLGISMVVLGICYFLEKYIPVEAFNPLIFAIGIAFMAIYFYRRNTFSLIFSVFILYYCLIKILSFFGLQYSVLIASSFTVCTGIIFLIIYFTKNRIAYLTPSCFMLCIGLFYLSFNFLKINYIILFLFYLSAFCISTFLLSKNRFSIFRLKIGILLLVITILQIVFSEKFLTLLIGGLIIIILSLFNHKKGK